jgi:hypothetical protein
VDSGEGCPFPLIFTALRIYAVHACGKLAHLWETPFQAIFRASNHSHLWIEPSLRPTDDSCSHQSDGSVAKASDRPKAFSLEGGFSRIMSEQLTKVFVYSLALAVALYFFFKPDGKR